MKRPSKWLASLLAASLVWAPIPAIAEDIDIFTGGSIAASNPSILIVLDNESQWANAAQQWPGGIQQGQAEANAIKALLADSTVINSGINVGLMEFVTAGNAGNTGGFVRFPISQMDDTNKAALSAHMDTIYGNITSSNEKRNSGTEYGNLMWDVYNYLTGSNTVDTLNPPNPSAASAAYEPEPTTPYTVFKSPITQANGCGRIFMIFIGNNTGSSSPVSNDTQANKDALSAKGCSTASVPLPNFTASSVTQQADLGSGVYASQAACETAAAAANASTPWATNTAYTVNQKVSYSGSVYKVIVAHTSSNSAKPDTNITHYTYSSPVFTSYTCSVASTSLAPTTLATSTCGQYASAAACESAETAARGTATYSSFTCTDTGSACGSTAVAGPSACGTYASVAACQAGVLAANPGFTAASCSVSGTACGGGSSSLGSYAGGLYATAGACQTAAASSWPGYVSYGCAPTSYTSGDLDGAACYDTAASCQTTVLGANPGYASVACGTAVACASATNSATCGGANDYNTQATCNALGASVLPGYPTYACVPSNDAICSAPGAKKWTVTASGKSSYQAIGTGSSWAVTGTAAAFGTRYDMSGSGGSTYTIKGNTATVTYNIFGNYTATVSVPTGTYNSTANSYMADEWARCLHQKDLSPDGTAAVAERFTANFNTSGAIVGADTITFDGVTTTLADNDLASAIATKVATKTYPHWTATNSSAGIVTFVSKTAGAPGSRTPPGHTTTVADFAIVDAGSTGTQPVVVVATTTPGADATGGALGRQNVTTYTIDVYNAQQNSEETALFMSMAQQGGGRYFAAKSQGAILSALKQIVSEIQSVNTAFAAASIPLSTTNRSQNLNEVYIGVFRPSLEPRWFGNLKKFKIAKVNGVLDLVDSLGATALNSQTGFLNDCGVSHWTTDSGNWWDKVKIGAASVLDNTLINPVPLSSCLAMPAGNTSPWSDLPDGQSVEKGAVADVIRRGNNPPTTAATPTWTVNRTIYTRSGSSLVALDATNAGSTNLYNYIRGVDINVDGSHVEEKTLSTAIANAVRPSVHGDVVHSRPLAVNYGTNDTVIYYGANDGMLRAVDGLTGKEIWAFMAAEFLDTTMQTRLMQNAPYVKFGAAPVTASTPKNYMFDGSAGLYQSLGNTKVWLYPTQRRGGRMVHALDVTSNTTPTLMWYRGCPNLDNNTGCNTTPDFDDIGQTWSVPVVTKIKGYSTTRPVVVFGGGYDNCEDVRPTTNPPTWTTTCASAKGRAVYVLDAEDGTLLKKFAISGLRGVTAGVSFIDVDNDGYSDYGYVADLGGAIHRLSFIGSPAVTTPLEKEYWTIKKVAYTSGSRKFMFSPAVTYGGKVNVSGTDVYSVYVALGSGDRERPLAEDYPYVNSIQNYIYGYRDTLENALTVAQKEVFEANFSSSGTIDSADTITFDGVTTTLAGDETPAQIAAAVAALAYPNWTAANTSGSATVTFSSRTAGNKTDVTDVDFVIVDPAINGVDNRPKVAVTKINDGLVGVAAGGASACDMDGNASADDACVLDYTTAPAACSSPGILPTESKKAWRVGFVYRGEQAVTQTVILGGMAVVNTTRPVPAGVCSAALGEGGGYFVNLINGSGAIGVSGSCGGAIRGTFIGVGLPTDPVVVNLPGEDPILIGAVSKTTTNVSTESKLFQPTPVTPPISKTKSRKYRYTVID